MFEEKNLREVDISSGQRERFRAETRLPGSNKLASAGTFATGRGLGTAEPPRRTIQRRSTDKGATAQDSTSPDQEM